MAELIQELLKQSEKYKKKYEEIASMNTDLKEKIISLTEENDSLKTDNEMMRLQLSSYESAFEDGDITTKIEKLCAEIKQKDKLIADLTNAKEHILKNLRQELNEALTKKMEEIDELRQKLRKQESENNCLLDKISALNEDILHNYVQRKIRELIFEDLDDKIVTLEI